VFEPEADAFCGDLRACEHPSEPDPSPQNGQIRGASA